jgi:two-component system, chemotaxis family, CheB/CheR fusion protein
MKKKAPAVPGETPAGGPQPEIDEKASPSPANEGPSFPVVGIGASAGGLKAFEAFFSGMPADKDPGMAFVLVQHLAPDHTSILSDLIRHFTRMQVFEVEDGMPVRINCVYIIPPKHDMAFLNGSLQLLAPTEPRGQRLSIDFFFHSLAQDQHQRAIGIVLSGTGSDGTFGVRAIKGEGGMVMVQNIGSAEFDGMPRSALATGLADYELPPAEMPAQLMAYAAQAFGTLPSAGASSPQASEGSMKRIFVLLRAQTGHDFSKYKPSTITRRVERRMAVQQIEGLDSYVKFLQQTPNEVEALFHDMLIGVTSFFRDPDVFRMLEEQIIPGLFEGRPAGAAVRIWSAGCSSGEEGYSIAILLAERMEALKQSYKVQVFATDIDSRAIAAARAGVYPASIATDLTPERLARFFTAEPDGSGYRVNKSIRDMLVFSEQDVIKDPPFSKLDLLSCRNLLIYLGTALQKKLMPMFHYALNPGGVLLLGTSEGIGECDDLFAALDRKSKLYRRREDPLRQVFPASPPSPQPATLSAPPQMPPVITPKDPLREQTEQALLQQIISVGALVKADGEILYLHGHTGMFLEPPPGKVGTSNILKMAREGLRPALTSTLHKVVGTKDTAHAPGVRVKSNGHFTAANLTIRPVTTGPAASPESPLYLVILEEVPVPPVVVAANPRADRLAKPAAEARIAALEQELRTKEESLQSMQEELESSSEELKSSNEEMQSVNEELQSTNEELETSKEEMQSVNEELSTVNTELQNKVAGLSRASNDLSNLIAGTGIGTIFVDFQLRILRFTPSVTEIINLISTDVGRPVAHIVSNLVSYDSLIKDTEDVLRTLVPRVVDVQTTANKWYTLRIQPYRTIDNVIQGAVITFVDITDRKRAEEALEKANALARLAVVVRDAHDAITVQDLEGRTIAWNAGAVRMYGWTEAEALAMNVRDRIPQELREEALVTLAKLSRAQIMEPYRTQRICQNGTVSDVSIISTALMDEAGQMYAIATTERAVGGQENIQ